MVFQSIYITYNTHTHTNPNLYFIGSSWGRSDKEQPPFEVLYVQLRRPAEVAVKVEEDQQGRMDGRHHRACGTPPALKVFALVTAVPPLTRGTRRLMTSGFYMPPSIGRYLAPNRPSVLLRFLLSASGTSKRLSWNTVCRAAICTSETAAELHKVRIELAADPNAHSVRRRTWPGGKVTSP